jgi:serine/threonine protein kinase
MQESFLNPGTKLENYQILETIHDSKKYAVYVAEENKKYYIIKELYPKKYTTRIKNYLLTDGEEENNQKFIENKKKFIREFKTLNELKHSGIIKSYEMLDLNNTLYQVMQYKNQPTVYDYIEVNGKLSETKFVFFFSRLLDIFEYIHGNGYLHRDVKPSNVLLSKKFEPTMIDFGQARTLEYVDNYFSPSGTRNFKAYEQYDSNHRQGPWTDIYSISAMMYFCIMGEEPIDSKQRFEENHVYRFDETKRYSGNILRTVEKGLEVLPENRYTSVQDFRKDLFK